MSGSVAVHQRGNVVSAVLANWLAAIIFVGLGLRIGVAVWNGFWGPSLGAELDALSFHRHAASFAQGEIDFNFTIGWLYGYALGLVYKFTGAHLVVGSLISCMAWLASAIVLKACVAQLAVKPSAQILALAAYCLLPSAIGYTSVTLREPFQLLAMNLMALAAIRLMLECAVRWAIVLVVAGVAAGLLHGALIVMGVLFAVSLTAWLLFMGWTRNKLTKVALPILALTAFVVYSALLFNGFSYGGQEANVVSAVQTHQEVLAAVPARANFPHYAVWPSLDSPMASALIGLFQYLFEPLPWRIQTGLDGVVAAENALRLILLLLALRSVIETRSTQRLTVFFLLLMYCCLEGMWSLGTANWGTAVRHHIPAMGILLVCAAAGFQERPRPGRQPT